MRKPSFFRLLSCKLL